MIQRLASFATERDAIAADALRDEPQDQVQGELPAVCPRGAPRAGRRLLRDGRRLAVHAARGAGQDGDSRDDGAAGSALRDRQAERAAFDNSSGDARGLLGEGR